MAVQLAPDDLIDLTDAQQRPVFAFSSTAATAHRRPRTGMLPPKRRRLNPNPEQPAAPPVTVWNPTVVVEGNQAAAVPHVDHGGVPQMVAHDSTSEGDTIIPNVVGGSAPGVASGKGKQKATDSISALPIAHDVCRQAAEMLGRSPDDQHLMTLARVAHRNNPAAGVQALLEQVIMEAFEVPDVIHVDSGGSSTMQPSDPSAQVLEIFPDVQRAFLQEQLACGQSVEQVVSLLADQKYPREDFKFKGGSAAGGACSSKDFNDTSWVTTADYRTVALARLNNEFPDTSKAALKKIFQNNQFHYWPTLKFIREVRQGDVSSLATRLQKAGLTPIMHSRKPEKISHRCEELEEELRYIQHELRSSQEAEDLAVARRINEEEATANNACIECGCCYSEVTFEDMVQCDEGHLFCKDCLKRFLEEQLFGTGRTVVRCMSAEGCEGCFRDMYLQRALPEKVYAKYQEALANQAVKEAGLEEQLVECPACGFTAELPPEIHVFACPNVDCGKETCRNCKEDNHVPLQCSEVEKKNETDRRLTVEEAMTRARLRQCPKCRKQFFKSEGCNKMTCACGTLICYVCREVINSSKYNHFCQRPHCDHKECKKCVLFSNSAEDDRRAMLEAGIKAKEEAEQEGVALEAVNVDKLLEDAKAAPPHHFHGLHGLPGAMPLPFMPPPMAGYVPFAPPPMQPPLMGGLGGNAVRAPALPAQDAANRLAEMLRERDRRREERRRERQEQKRARQRVRQAAERLRQALDRAQQAADRETQAAAQLAQAQGGWQAGANGHP